MRLFRCAFTTAIGRTHRLLPVIGLLAWLWVGTAPTGILRAQDEPPVTHEVRAGETLSEIAAAYGVTLDEVMALNGISDPNAIYQGQELTLPANAIRIGQPTFDIPTHTVVAGETLSEIARQYDLPLLRVAWLLVALASLPLAGQVSGVQLC